MAKTKYDCMKHFSLFLSNPGGWSLLAQLWKASLKEIRGGMGSLPGKVLAPPGTACAEVGPAFSDLSVTSYGSLSNF